MRWNFKGMNGRFLSVLLTAGVMAGVASGCGSTAGNTLTDGSAASAVSAATAAADSADAVSTQTASSSETGAGAQSGVATADNSAIDATANRPVSEGEEIDASKLSNVPSSSQEGASTAASSGETKSWPDLANGTTARDIMDASGDTPQIVVFGDSQFDNDRTSNGMSAKLAYYAHSRVYNCAIGGTTASVENAQEEVQTPSEFSDNEFIGVAYAATGQADPAKIFGNHYAYNVFMGCDLSKTDIFIVEYGVNDYFSKRQCGGNGSQTYQGALEIGCAMLKNKYPNAAIIICGPGYVQFFKGNTFVGDSNTMNNGIAWLYHYADTAQNVATSKGYDYLNGYRQLGIDTSNASDYLLDGVHLNPSGREKYAMALARISLHLLGYQLPEMVDLSTADYSTFTKK